jgi:hypothetical protein
MTLPVKNTAARRVAATLFGSDGQGCFAQKRGLDPSNLGFRVTKQPQVGVQSPFLCKAGQGSCRAVQLVAPMRLHGYA